MSLKMLTPILGHPARRFFKRILLFLECNNRLDRLKTRVSICYGLAPVTRIATIQTRINHPSFSADSLVLRVLHTIR